MTRRALATAATLTAIHTSNTRRRRRCRVVGPRKSSRSAATIGRRSGVARRHRPWQWRRRFELCRRATRAATHGPDPSRASTQPREPPSKTRSSTIGRPPNLGACSRAAESGPDARRARRSDRSVAGGYVRIRTAAARQRRWSAIGGARRRRHSTRRCARLPGSHIGQGGRRWPRPIPPGHLRYLPTPPVPPSMQPPGTVPPPPRAASRRRSTAAVGAARLPGARRAVRDREARPHRAEPGVRADVADRVRSAGRCCMR